MTTTDTLILYIKYSLCNIIPYTLTYLTQKQQTPPTNSHHLALLQKQSWSIATSPLKQLPMNAFMLWMSGNSVQIFSIIITGMMLMNGIKGVIGVGSGMLVGDRGLKCVNRG